MYVAPWMHGDPTQYASFNFPQPQHSSGFPHSLYVSYLLMQQLKGRTAFVPPSPLHQSFAPLLPLSPIAPSLRLSPIAPSPYCTLSITPSQHVSSSSEVTLFPPIAWAH